MGKSASESVRGFSCEASDIDDNSQVTMDDFTCLKEQYLKICNLTLPTPTPTPTPGDASWTSCITGTDTSKDCNTICAELGKVAQVNCLWPEDETYRLPKQLVCMENYCYNTTCSDSSAGSGASIHCSGFNGKIESQCIHSYGSEEHSGKCCCQ